MIAGTVGNQIFIHYFGLIEVVHIKPAFSGMDAQVYQKIKILVKLVVFAILPGIRMVTGIGFFFVFRIVTANKRQGEQKDYFFHKKMGEGFEINQAQNLCHNLFLKLHKKHSYR